MLRFLSNRRFATLDDFLVPASVLQTTVVPAVGALQNGGFVMTWMTSNESDASIAAQIYDRNGRTVGNQIVVSPGAAWNFQPDVAVLSSGGFVISWTTQGNTQVPGGVQARIYDPAGAPVGAQFAVDITPGTTSQIVALVGGGFVITSFAYAGTFDNIHGQVFTANGTKVGNEFLGGDAVLGTKADPDLIALSGGGFVVSWFQPGGDSSFGYGVRAQIFDASGNKLGAAFTVNTITEGAQVSAKLAALPSGGFVAVWADDGTTQSANPDNGNQGIWAQMFDATGHKVGANIFVDHRSDMADVEVIPGIGFAVIWKETSDPDSPEFGGLRMQIFDFEGHRTGEEFTIAPHAQSGPNWEIQNLPDITALAGGGLVVNWLDWMPNIDRENPHTTILFPTVHGTENADVISGTVNRDFFLGFGGDDQLSGGSENDSLDGGDGNDQLLGGDGNDFIIGGGGADLMEGGAGADIFQFASAGDTLGYVLRSDGKQMRPDVIADFANGVDKIDLGAIDAIAGTSADDAFTFIGTNAFSAFGNHAGQLRYENANGHTYIYGDVNGDGLADLQIVLLPGVGLTLTDFVL